MIIQIVLSVILIYLIARVLSQPLFSTLAKLGVAVIIGAGILFVFWPSAANSIAHLVGVGRGADLFSYLAISVGAVVLFGFYLRIRSLELRNVELVRQLAIQQFDIQRTISGGGQGFPPRAGSQELV
jgi:small membrane protein